MAALLNTISLYHDTLLNRVVQSDPKYKPLIPSSPHSRYTRAWVKKDSRYKWFARTLEVLRYLELLIEMGLRRTVSNRTRWRVVVLVECIKYVTSVSTPRPQWDLILVPEFLGRFYGWPFCVQRGDHWLAHRYPREISTLHPFHPLLILRLQRWHLLHLLRPRPRRQTTSRTTTFRYSPTISSSHRLPLPWLSHL